jgi:hypothetical protein
MGPTWRGCLVGKGTIEFCRAAGVPWAAGQTVASRAHRAGSDRALTALLAVGLDGRRNGVGARAERYPDGRHATAQMTRPTTAATIKSSRVRSRARRVSLPSASTMLTGPSLRYSRIRPLAATSAGTNVVPEG